MNKLPYTILYLLVAFGLCVGAYYSFPTPQRAEMFSDEGKDFYPQFTEAGKCAALEVATWDEAKNAPDILAVRVKDGLWTIPSHNDYPADAKDRLSKTATSIIGLKKGKLCSTNKADFAKFGVVDPSKPEDFKSGYGKKVTLKDASDSVLASFIIGNAIKEDGSFSMKESGQRYYVRVPEQKHVYEVTSEFDISTQFSDWIETDLLKLNADEISKVAYHLYEFGNRDGMLFIEREQVYSLSKNEKDNTWSSENVDIAPDKKLDDAKLRELVSLLPTLKIADVFPKPKEIKDYLNGTISVDSQSFEGQFFQAQVRQLLGEKGFFVANKLLIPQNHEMSVTTKDGIVYSLKFGNVQSVTKKDDKKNGTPPTPGTPQASPAPGAAPTPAGEKQLSENRYLLLTVKFNENLLAKPEKPAPAPIPASTPKPAAGTPGAPATPAATPKPEDVEKQYQEKLQEWEKKRDEVRKKADGLKQRFSGWYYVVNNENYNKLILKPADLVTAKEPPQTPPPAGQPAGQPMPLPGMSPAGGNPNVPPPPPPGR